jgi:hypothetical protein
MAQYRLAFAHDNTSGITVSRSTPTTFPVNGDDPILIAVVASARYALN